jgi:hypothetical protein
MTAQPLLPKLTLGLDLGDTTSHYCGFEAVADGLWDVYYRTLKLGRFSERTGRIEDDRGRLLRHRRVSTMSPV